MTRARDVAKQGGMTIIIPTSIAVGSGSGSVSANGLITYTGASSISLNGCFTSTYDNYVIYWTPTVSSVSGSNLFVRVRASGTDDTSAAYNWAGGSTTIGGTFSYTSGGSQTAMFVGVGSYTGGNYGTTEIVVSNPAKALWTTIFSRGSGVNPSGLAQTTQQQGSHNTASAYDGITIYQSSGTITGTARIYGYNNGA